MIYQHPLAYLLGLEGLALMRAWAGEYGEDFVRARIGEIRALLADPALAAHPGVWVAGGATSDAYREWAPSYDDPGNELLDLDLPLMDEILATLPAGQAVDAACGTGRLAARLAARGHTVTGVDESEPMLHVAGDRVPGVQFVAGELEHLPLSDHAADVLTCGLALTHVRHLEPVFTEFARVLRPGGTAIISDVHPELLYRGSVVKSETAAGEPQVAAFHGHTVGDHVRAALAAGFVLRGLEEPRSVVSGDLDFSPDSPPSSEPGAWRLWPWTLLERVPEAARAAWDSPALLVMHLLRS